MTTLAELEISYHASVRMMERAITEDDANNALLSGYREERGAFALHYDLQTRVGIVVNWQRGIVVTALRLGRPNYARLRALAAQAERAKAIAATLLGRNEE